MMRLLPIFILVLSGCQTIQLERPYDVPDDAWITDGGSTLRQRAGSERIPPPLVVAWQYNAAAGFGPGSPLLVRDRLFVGTRKGEMHAVDLASGRRTGYREFNEAIEGTPAISDGILYVTSPWGNRALIAYDLERASVKWRVSGVPVEVAPVVAGNVVVIVDVEATVRAYRTGNGEEVWRHHLEERTSVHSTPLLLADGRLFVATDRGGLVMMDASNGDVLWQTSIDLPVRAGAASDGERIYIPTTRGVLVAVDVQSGKVLWEHRNPNRLVRMAPPAVKGGRLIFGASDGTVRRLDAISGVQEWTVNVGAVVDAPPQWTHSAVYVGTMGRELLALDAESGAISWRHQLEGRIKSAMAAADGALYVLSEPRYVVKFIPATEGEDE
ncbi:MAG: PQQ-binding-like beta-propeller repeat protein [Rhodothermales bacterium]